MTTTTTAADANKALVLAGVKKGFSSIAIRAFSTACSAMITSSTTHRFKRHRSDQGAFEKPSG